MANDIKNIFISHIHEDDSALEDLKNLLKKNGMEARDYSINSDKPNRAKDEHYIKNKILAPQIDSCSTLIVYISRETKDSKYVNWEIKYALEKGKTIVGVWERGIKECDVPDALGKYADAIVGWNGSSIIDAINGASIHENPDGTERPKQNIDRHGCD